MSVTAPPSRPVPDGYVDAEEAARLIPCSLRKVRYLIAEGAIPSTLYAPSHRRIMRREDVIAYAAKQLAGVR